MAEKKKSRTKKKMKVDKRISYGDYEFPTMSCFPKDKWKIWDADCKQNHGDIRWVKAWQDHLLSKQHAKEDAMWNVILQLKQDIDELKKKPEEKEEKEVTTFSGKAE